MGIYQFEDDSSYSFDATKSRGEMHSMAISRKGMSEIVICVTIGILAGILLIPPLSNQNSNSGNASVNNDLNTTVNSAGLLYNLPITINNNTDFANQAQANGWLATGQWEIRTSSKICKLT